MKRAPQGARRNGMRLFTVLLCSTFVMLQGQPVSVGAKGGFLLTDATRYRSDESRNYTVGPSVEFRLPGNFGVETGFLYKRIGMSSNIRFDGSQIVSRTRANSFEIPVIGKYYVRSAKPVTPFFGLGVAMRRAWESTDSSIFGPGVLLPGRSDFRTTDVSPFGAGAVGAAGVQFGFGRWKVSPEFRYTRWSQETQRIARNPNQVELLVGVSF